MIFLKKKKENNLLRLDHNKILLIMIDIPFILMTFLPLQITIETKNNYIGNIILFT